MKRVFCLIFISLTFVIIPPFSIKLYAVDLNILSNENSIQRYQKYMKSLQNEDEQLKFVDKILRDELGKLKSNTISINSKLYAALYIVGLYKRTNDSEIIAKNIMLKIPESEFLIVKGKKNKYLALSEDFGFPSVVTLFRIGKKAIPNIIKVLYNAKNIEQKKMLCHTLLLITFWSSSNCTMSLIKREASKFRPINESNEQKKIFVEKTNEIQSLIKELYWE